MRQLLSDITVIELAEGVAGSYCGKLFADLGATVLKVERPGGDPLRRDPAAPTIPPGGTRTGAVLHLQLNKRSVVIDPDRPADVERLWSLAANADLVIEALPEGGSLGEWGRTWDDLHAALPALSVVAISGFGATGPYASYKWDDITVQAFAGSLLLQNRSDQDPVKLPGAVAQCFVGHIAALGALGAVMRARSSGEGAFIDCAATEALATQPGRASMLLSHHYRERQPQPVVIQSGPDSSSTLIPMGVFPCGDGYVAMMSTPQQLREMLDVLNDDDLRAAFARPDAFTRGETKEILDAVLYPWLLTQTRAEITKAAQDVGWPLAGVNSPDDVLAADHLHQRGFWVHDNDPQVGSIDLPGPPCRYAEGGWALRRSAPGLGEHTDELEELLSRSTGSDGAEAAAPGRSDLPLKGIRVVDLTTVWSGPYATMLLSDLGAEVIRVENPWVLPPTTKGYAARPNLSDPGFLGSMYGPIADGQPDRPWNRHAMNNSITRNKLSWTVDTRTDEGRELLMRLVERSDVFIENFKASGLSRMGIMVSELQARNPRLVILRMPPTGTTGDWAHYTGFGAQFDGLTGLTSLLGHPDVDLLASPSTTYMDAASGPAAAYAVVAALYYRASTGRGQVVELPQSENVIQHLGEFFVDHQMGVPAVRTGNRSRWRAPQGLYRCRDGRWLAISVASDDEWSALAAAIGQPGLADEKRFATHHDRLANHDELDTLLGAWAAEQDPKDAFHALARAGVAAGPLLDDEGFSSDPQIVARDWLRPLTSDDVGSHAHPGWPYRGLPMEWRRGSPVLGQDNEYVYKEILGVSDEDYERYRGQRMVSDAYLDPSGNPY
jgi:crotonobetainyl-CoA:carnitine CoA-transferase CaiB-like acyl-CoA transferase